MSTRETNLFLVLNLFKLLADPNQLFELNPLLIFDSNILLFYIIPLLIKSILL
jgi:predicted acyltransferase